MLFGGRCFLVGIWWLSLDRFRGVGVWIFEGFLGFVCLGRRFCFTRFGFFLVWRRGYVILRN